MQTLHISNRSDVLQKLLGHSTGESVSIYVPLELPGAGVQQNSARIRGMLDQAATDLKARGLTGRDVDYLLSELRASLDIGEIDRLGSRGLAMFASEGFSALLPMDEAPPQQLEVGPNFLVRPLLAQLSPAGDYYLLAVNLDESRLLELGPDRIEEIDLGQAVSGASQLRLHGERAGMQHYGSSGEGAMSTRYFAHGEQDRNRELAEQSHAEELAATVDRLLADARLPLLLAGEDSLVGELRRRLGYGRLLPFTLSGNTVRSSSRELHARSLPLMEQQAEQEHRELLQKLHASQSRDGRSVADDPGEVLQAAASGLVDTLFITPEGGPFGSYDKARGRLQLERRGTDLANQAAVLTLQNGGRVLFAGAEELGGPTRMLAGLRN